ncbi:MAG: FHA domain-containing protein [Anaerolineae bacterium]|jgi:pSer/pThr/pTyr-binding forkhead associated (FHA) protein|nr:FHA domain-containing protein [Anaerolineae bacterium]
MDEITIALMSGPQDGAMLSFETLLDDGGPVEITIGRREGCDICLSYDSQVSREHARLIFDGNCFWLEDMDSTNGTFLDEDKITGRVEIEPGELFRVGRTWLRVEPMVSFASSDDDDLPF